MREHARRASHYTWDGVAWSGQQPEFKHWYMFTSSYIHAGEVSAFRESFFDAWSKEVGKKLIEADEILRGFHLIQIEGMESRSVLMERDRSHTKSIIQADIHGHELTLRYFPEVLEKMLTEVRTERIGIRK